MNIQQLAAYFDHTLLKADANEQAIRKLCQEALEWKFASVCINPCWVPLGVELLKGSSVKVCTVVGFPLGANAFELKAHETKLSCDQGAGEIDMVMNIGWALSGHWDAVTDDIYSVVTAAGSTPVKVILETCFLNDDQIIRACKAASDTGALFVKTSTGFGTAGARVHHVQLMRKNIPSTMKVKASGGVRSLQDTLSLIEAGAERIGASASVAILKELKGEGNAGVSSGY